MKITSTLACVMALAFALTGCASHVKATRTTNPPPAEAYSQFGRIEIQHVALAPEFRGQSPNETAAIKIDANLSKRLVNHLAQWNSRPDNGRKLVIEPVITNIRFIGVGVRIFTGPFSGSSGVVIQMKATDAGTGKVIDQAEFYQRSSAGAGFAIGVADNMMLTRMGELMGDYILHNFDAAVGGTTGATDELTQPQAQAAE